ncbi:MAG: hypothetical protein HY331_04040 [Chloroflexi bacterium]|nr:hypothetical protein [Chloroflexota bacterium]
MLERFSLNYAPAVAAELREDFASGREFWRLARQGVLVEAVPRSEEVKSFGAGERAAINLALEHRDWVLLLDDRRPLLGAQRLGLRAVCTPVLVADLFDEGRLSPAQALQALARLTALKTVSPALIEAALLHVGIGWERREK